MVGFWCCCAAAESEVHSVAINGFSYVYYDGNYYPPDLVFGFDIEFVKYGTGATDGPGESGTPVSSRETVFVLQFSTPGNLPLLRSASALRLLSRDFTKQTVEFGNPVIDSNPVAMEYTLLPGFGLLVNDALHAPAYGTQLTFFHQYPVVPGQPQLHSTQEVDLSPLLAAWKLLGEDHMHVMVRATGYPIPTQEEVDSQGSPTWALSHSQIWQTGNAAEMET